MIDSSPGRSWASSVLREPTLHFLLLALALFVANAVVRNRSGANRLEIDRSRVTARIARIEASLGARLTAEDRRQVEEDYIDEQVLVREAQALGLEDDPQIHDLLAQKMLDVLSAEVLRPSRSELETYYTANQGRYATAATVTLDELVVGTAESLPPALREQLRNGLAPEDLVADLPLRKGVLPQISRDELVRIFGTSTAEMVLAAGTGEWVGPHPSVRGQHWFRVTERTESVLPPLESLQERVRLDWIGEQELVRLREKVGELRARHPVVFIGEEPEP